MAVINVPDSRPAQARNLHKNATQSAIHTPNYVIPCLMVTMSPQACKLHSSTCMKSRKSTFCTKIIFWLGWN